MALVLNPHTVTAAWYRVINFDLTKLLFMYTNYILNIFNENISVYMKAIHWYGLTV